jgi:hypothetical protein
MFGVYIRAVLGIGGAVLVASMLSFIGLFFLPLLGPADGLLYRSFSGILDNALFIFLVGIGAAVIARAVVESSAGVR